jgi:hypothetical protein
MVNIPVNHCGPIWDVIQTLTTETAGLKQKIAELQEDCDRADKLADDAELIAKNSELVTQNALLHKRITELTTNAQVQTYHDLLFEARRIDLDHLSNARQRIAQLADLVPVLQFASHYPTWTTWAEFAQLPDYKYISEVLDNPIAMPHNFGGGAGGDGGFYLIDQDNHGPEHHMIPPFGTSRVMKKLIDTWTGDHAGYYKRASLFTSSVANPPGQLHDFISLYIIGVLAGWLNIYSEKIRPYEYLIFIDVGQLITFRLVTMQKHAECPAVFFFDKHRVIINGAIRRDL